MNDVREVQVAPARADEVPRADSVPVAVAAERENGEPGVREASAGGDRQHAAVQRVEAVPVDVVRRLPAAADAAEDRELVGVDLHLLEGHLDAGEDAKIATPWTPVVVQIALVVLERELHRRVNGHGSPPPPPWRRRRPSRGHCSSRPR